MRFVRILLVIIAVVCFGVALSYPIRYRMAQESNNSSMEQLSALRSRGQEDVQTEAPEPRAQQGAQAPRAKAGEAAQSGEEQATSPRDIAPDDAPLSTAQAAGQAVAAAQEPAPQSRAAEGGPTPTAGEEAAPTAALAVNDIAGEAPEAEPAGDAREMSAPTGTNQGIEEAPPDEASSAWEPAAASAALDEPVETNSVEAAEGRPAWEEAPPDEPEGASAEAASAPAGTPTPTPAPTPTPGIMDLILEGIQTPAPEAPNRPGPTDTPVPTPLPSPTPDRRIHTGALPYPLKDKVELDEADILPELQEIREMNGDLVGWIAIPGTVIDYPVVQSEDSEFYLTHDFYGNENVNGQIILDTLCDPYTPSYNLVVSGHHMKNGSMFGDLPEYSRQGYWERHKFLEFDTLMERKQFVIFAAFYSADYDEDEEGFRYNADIQYAKEAEQWLAEVRENQLYDTEIDVGFGDEFITLTTCNRARHRNGRFVVVCRRIREGETFE